MIRSFLILLIIAAIITLFSSTFTLNEAEQALITQFGEIRGKPITKAGLHWKIPFIQDVRIFDKRILSWDGDEEQIPTKDKKYIWVDTTARWKIIDIVKFAQTLNNEHQTKAKLDTILDGITRDTISSHNLVEAVRNTNAILNRETANQDIDPTAEQVEEEITGEIEPIQVGRDQLSKQIAARATGELERFGIELIDVQLRRIAYEKSVEAKVFDRMISERKRIAEKIRSIGKGEEAKIKGKLNKDLKTIESEAYKEAQDIRGKAQAKATAIYASSIKASPSYFKFYRTLDAYKALAGEDKTLILSTEGDFFQYLKSNK